MQWSHYRTRQRTMAVAGALMGVGVLAGALAAGAQAAGGVDTTYQRTVVAIQEQIESGRLDEARARIAEAQRTYPHSGGLDNLRGVVEIQQGHSEAARRAFASAIAEDPRLVGAYLNLNRMNMDAAAREQKARTEALRLCRKVLQLDPANEEAQYQAATLLFWNREYRESLEHLDKLGAEARSKIGAAALACGDAAALGPRERTEAAARALAAHADLTEQDAETCLPTLRAARRADLIEELLAAAASRQALSAEGLRILGLAQEGEGKLTEARTTLEQAFAAAATSVDILEDLARVAKAANDNKGALGYLAHARDLQPKNAALAYEFGSVCLHMGLFAEARKAMGEALRLKPDDADYNLGMGTVVSFSADPSQSLPYLDRYHVLRPQDPRGVLMLGAANYRAKDYDSAARWLRQAVASRDTAAEAHYYLGRIARQEGRVDEAVTELKQSLARHPGDADVLAELGQISVQRREFGPAETYFDEALRRDPESYAANFGLLQLYARTGDARREEQSRRFEQIKSLRDEQERQMMRALEIRPN